MNDNGVARTLKNYAHQRETTVSRNCVPFLNENFSERKEFAPRGSEFFQRERILSFMSSSCLYGK